MASTANSSKNPSLNGGQDRALHITHICTARNEAWSTSDHAIPNFARFFVATVARTDQITPESSE
jgi:hypothetical protein